MRQERSFAIKEMLEYRIGDRDYAIVRLEGDPGIEFTHAIISSSDASINDVLCIIGHPQQLPKRVITGHCSTLQGNMIAYSDIDTAGGDSGARILGLNSNIVGIHTRGGCETVNIGLNRGERISSLLAVSKILKSLV